ncbi:uncharacterized protein ABDE67_014631 [Symphorus nematophorus]
MLLAAPQSSAAAQVQQLDRDSSYLLCWCLFSTSDSDETTRLPGELRHSCSQSQSSILLHYRRSSPVSNRAPPKQFTTAVNVSPVKRTLLTAAAVFLGLLCLVLLVAVLVLVVLLIQDKNSWNRLSSERDKLQREKYLLKAVNSNLTNQREELQKQKNLLKAVNNNLTNEREELQKQKNLLKAVNNNLTNQRDELQKQIEMHYCPDHWITFGKSCYSVFTSKKTWTDSKKYCEDEDAHLVIISNTEEQRFVSSLNQRVWIGLTDEETEGVWKWVDGTEVNGMYWRHDQPDNYPPAENCVEIVTDSSDLNNWNDFFCSASSDFICEYDP